MKRFWVVWLKESVDCYLLFEQKKTLQWADKAQQENGSPDAEFNQSSFIYIAVFIQIKTQSTPIVINDCNPTIKYHVKLSEVTYIYNPGIMCLSPSNQKNKN